MKKTSLLAALVLSISLMSPPSSACLPWPWASVVSWTISAAFAGLGAVSIVYQVRSENAYAATFSPSTLVITGFEPLNQQCASCFNNAPSSCTYYPWGATYLASYEALCGNQTATFNTTGLSMMYSGDTGTFFCGRSAQEAVAKIAAHVNVGTTRSMWYQKANPSTWTFYVMSPSSPWAAGIAVSAVVSLTSAMVGGFLFCLK